MPYSIYKVDNGFKVFNTETFKTYSKLPLSFDKAKTQLRILNSRGGSINNIYLSFSPKKDKKFRVRIGNKNIDFGQKGYSDFILSGGDENKKRAYIARHSKMGEDWTKNGIKTRGFWALHLLWNKRSLFDSIKDIENKFNVNIIFE